MSRQHIIQTKQAIAPPQTQSHASDRHSPHPIEELQGAIGNRAVNQLLASQPRQQAKPMFGGLSGELQNSPMQGKGGQQPTVLQAKLEIGAVGDKYEQEADRVAAQVVSLINAPQSQTLQRENISNKSEEEELQAKPEITALQRQEEKQEVLQGKSIFQSEEAIAGGEASTDLESAINRARGGGQPLDAGLQGAMEQAFGADFSGVRIHTDAQADQLNQSIQAKAFTTGQDVFFRQGEYQPASQGGQELLAHELTHVVQQGKPQEGVSVVQMTRNSKKARNSQSSESQQPATSILDAITEDGLRYIMSMVDVQTLGRLRQTSRKVKELAEECISHRDSTSPLHLKRIAGEIRSFITWSKSESIFFKYGLSVEDARFVHDTLMQIYNELFAGVPRNLTPILQDMRKCSLIIIKVTVQTLEKNIQFRGVNIISIIEEYQGKFKAIDDLIKSIYPRELPEDIM